MFGPMRGAGEQLSRLASADEGVVVGLDQMIFSEWTHHAFYLCITFLLPARSRRAGAGPVDSMNG